MRPPPPGVDEPGALTKLIDGVFETVFGAGPPPSPDDTAILCGPFGPRPPAPSPPGP